MPAVDVYSRQEAVAFAPCHVSAFFVPHIEPRTPEKTGSWGAGICLGAGVAAKVQVEPSDTPGIKVHRQHAPEGEDGSARVTEAALRMLLSDHPLEVTCTVQEGAPVGQGLGVSGASALAASFALARCLGEGRSTALRAAHVAEVRNRTGLGDVVASFLGGAVLRSAPGIAPHGAQQRLPVQGDLVLATVGEGIETQGVLRDREVMERISKVGTNCMQTVLQRPSLEAIFEQGALFDRETDLVSDETLTAIEACAEGGYAMAALLGNTVAAYGDTDILLDVLQGWGQPHVVPIDQSGLRLLDALPERA
ncbi:MAG: hypothetical protein R3185_05595 [Candidatus Thermoplasmatota archaeon]|nr:hypothetical protein [Candidatus Thermoplasmatota archaeon]